tara:strand:- start:229 stop:390 length:162 start_codon:yes stop_codon:yes gene_type:complete
MKIEKSAKNWAVGGIRINASGMYLPEWMPLDSRSGGPVRLLVINRVRILILIG